MKKARVQKAEHKIDMTNALSDSLSKRRRRDREEKKNKLGITEVEDKRKGQWQRWKECHG